MNLFKKAFKRILIAVLSVGLVTVPTFDRVKTVEAVDHTGGYVYFLKPASWTESTVMMFIGHNSWTSVYKMSKISNTDNLYKFDMQSWGGATYVAFANAGSTWEDGKWGPDNRKNAPHYTNIHNDYGFNKGSYYVVVPESSSNNAKITIDYKNSASALNLTTTASAYENGVANAKAGTVSISGNYMSGDSTASTRTVSSTVSTPKASDTFAPGSTVTFKATPSENYEFLGWSTSTSGTNYVSTSLTYTHKYDISYTGKTLYAHFASKIITYVVDVDVNGEKYSTIVNKGDTYKNAIDSVKNQFDENLNIVDWNTDINKEVTGNSTITATKYYTNIEKVEAQLGFNYSYVDPKNVNTLVSFQGPIEYGEETYCTAGIKGTDYTEKIIMAWNNDEQDGKKEFVANIPARFNQLTFSWGNEDSTNKTKTFDRDFTNNAIWYNNGSSFGKYTFTKNTLHDEAIKAGVKLDQIDVYSAVVERVTNMKMRLSSGLYATSNIEGAVNYGIELTKGDKTNELIWNKDMISRVNENGEADEKGNYYIWSAVLNNISTENYTTNITARVYVTFDESETATKYYLCDARTVSVVSLSEIYSQKLSGVEGIVCGYITATYNA